MKVVSKLSVHLEKIMMPRGIPMTAKQVVELCLTADEASRRAAVDRARIKAPFLLPDEEHEAEEWARRGSYET